MLALLPDNTTGAISAADMRAIVTSLYDDTQTRALAEAVALAFAERDAELPEDIRDTMAQTLVAGSNVSITVDDTANTITIAASGGGADLSAYARFVFATDATPNPVRPGATGGLVFWVDTRSDQSTDPTTKEPQDIIIGGQAPPAPEPPQIITTALDSMVVNVNFTQQIVVEGDPPFTFGATGLPAGLTINTATGIVSGTPTAAGSGNAAVTAENAAGEDEQTMPWTVAAALTPPVIGPTSLNPMTQNQAFSQTLTNSGGPIASVTTLGTVPAGVSVTLQATLPVVSGTPTGSGPYSFTVRATNAAGSDDQLYAGTIEPAPLPENGSVFTAASPGPSTIYTDGGGSLRMGNRFQSDTEVQVLGMRLWNPADADAPLLGSDITVQAYLNDYQGSQIVGSITWASTPVVTQVYTTTRVAGTWTEVLFETPITLPAISNTPGLDDVLSLVVGYAGGNYYVVVDGLVADPYVSPQGHVSLVQASDPGRGINTLITGVTSTYYGIDIIFEVP